MPANNIKIMLDNGDVKEARMNQGAERVTAKSRRSSEKQVSLTVLPPNPAAAKDDLIQVEVRRQPSMGKRRSQRRFALCLAAVMMLMVLPMIRDGLAYYHLHQQYQALQAEQGRLLSIQEGLRQELVSLDDPVIIEKMARENLGLVKPGESKVVQSIPTENIPQKETIKAGEAVH